MIMSIILFIIVIALLAMIISSTVRIVPQAHAYVVERLGAYQGTWSVGLHVKVPFIDRVARKVNLKEQVVDFPPQPVITKDNVTMQIDTVGEKKSAILRAEGQKESMVLQAEGDKEAAILRAEAKKEATIREAEGQAEAIRAIQKANAQGIESIKAAKADDAVIQLKSLEAFAKAADGKATKIIIPSEIQGMAGLVKSITEVAKDDEKNIADLIEEQVQDTVKEQ